MDDDLRSFSDDLQWLNEVRRWLLYFPARVYFSGGGGMLWVCVCVFLDRETDIINEGYETFFRFYI